MDNFVLELVKRYGAVAVIAAVIIASLVWGFAHFASEPGTPVKVLWGLVEYTKAPGGTRPTQETAEPADQRTEVRAVASKTPESSQSRPSPEAMTLSVSHGLTLDNQTEILESLRARNTLRELRPIESDRPISASPPGTFFFVPSLFLTANDQTLGGKALLSKHASRIRSSSWSDFEVHHRGSGEILLLGYVSESDADRIRELTGDREFQVTIATQPWGSFTSLVEIPFGRIVSSDFRRLAVQEGESLDVLDTVVR